MKIERKYMAHYLNATFAADDGTASYVRLGKDLEEYSPELSANVEKKTNILGNETVSIDSYQKQGEVSPYYAEKGDPLFEKLQSIIDNDLVLDDLKTDIVEVKLWTPRAAARSLRCGKSATSRSAATAVTPQVIRFRSTCIILALKPKARSTPPPRHSPPRHERSSHHGTGY